jgi:hypothetical protein
LEKKKFNFYEKKSYFNKYVFNVVVMETLQEFNLGIKISGAAKCLLQEIVEEELTNNFEEESKKLKEGEYLMKFTRPTLKENKYFDDFDVYSQNEQEQFDEEYNIDKDEDRLDPEEVKLEKDDHNESDSSDDDDDDEFFNRKFEIKKKASKKRKRFDKELFNSYDSTSGY